MREVVFFSGNAGKIKEVENKFNKYSIKILSLKNFSNYKEPNEIGNTFSENAKIKSFYGFLRFKKPCFADDSGICIEALNKNPGVNSKTFLESFRNSETCLNYIINEVKKTNNFNAFFKTVICLTVSKEKVLYFEGVVNGRISDKIIGAGGFGYDPLFLPDESESTFAEISLEEKAKISHRARALAKLVAWLEKAPTN